MVILHSAALSHHRATSLFLKWIKHITFKTPPLRSYIFYFFHTFLWGLTQTLRSSFKPSRSSFCSILVITMKGSVSKYVWSYLSGFNSEVDISLLFCLHLSLTFIRALLKFARSLCKLNLLLLLLFENGIFLLPCWPYLTLRITWALDCWCDCQCSLVSPRSASSYGMVTLPHEVNHVQIGVFCSKVVFYNGVLQVNVKSML